MPFPKCSINSIDHEDVSKDLTHTLSCAFHCMRFSHRDILVLRCRLI
jgi:hypothetical protein